MLPLRPVETRVMKYLEKRGDLFSTQPEVPLAHCISRDCKMGKGIAASFKERYGGIEKLQAVQKAQPGGFILAKCGERKIYHLVTKNQYWEKPSYQALKQSLEKMKDHMVAGGLQNLAMPRIGTGLDGLDWNRVSEMIQTIFKQTGITVTIYYL